MQVKEYNIDDISTKSIIKDYKKNNSNIFRISFKYECKKEKAYKIISSLIEDEFTASSVTEDGNKEDKYITLDIYKRTKRKLVYPETDNHFDKSKDRYQYHTLLAAQAHITKYRNAIDIGGHIGIYSAALSEIFNVTAFEPSPINYKCYEKNVPNATLHKCGLGNKNEILKLSLDENNTGNNSIVEDIGVNKIDIPIKRLDDFNFKDIDLIKIDVQGFEEQVLLGSKETIMREKPILIIEVITHKNMPPNELILKIMKDFNYKVLSIIGKDYIFGAK